MTCGKITKINRHRQGSWLAICCQGNLAEAVKSLVKTAVRDLKTVKLHEQHMASNLKLVLAVYNAWAMLSHACWLI